MVVPAQLKIMSRDLFGDCHSELKEGATRTPTLGISCAGERQSCISDVTPRRKGGTNFPGGQPGRPEVSHAT